MARFPHLQLHSAIRRSLERRFFFPIISVAAILAGVLVGTVTGLELDFRQLGPEVGRLNTPGRPNSIITVYADDGKSELGKYALLLHSPLKYEQIPDVMKKAVMAVDEPRFLEHDSLDPLRMANTAIRTLTLNSADDGPTLAQEVSKILLSRELTFRGKIQNFVLGIMLERLYTKDQIIWMYANHCHLGEIVYGVEAGARTYFGKPAAILTLDEAALLAGMPKAPNYYSPTNNVQAARIRRDQVLDSMVRSGYATQQDADKAKTTPIFSSAISPSFPNYSEFSYPLEEIRKYVESKYGSVGDLKVYSTINIDAQRNATQEIRQELRRRDRLANSWRSKYSRISSGMPTQEQLDAYKHPDWYVDIYQHEPYQRDTYITGLITRIDSAAKETTVRFGSYTAKLTVSDMGWSGKQPDTEFKIGDLAEFYIKDVSNANKHLSVELSQIPTARAAQLTLDAGTGEILTMVGGYDFYSDNSNNTTETYRQTGPVFQPFIYAAAIEWGMTEDTLVPGEPIQIGEWQPRNSDGSLGNHALPFKTVVSTSLNVPTVHLMQIVGIQTTAQMVRRFGISDPMPPYLPSALGLAEIPLDQMVSAYSAFANKGVRVEPHIIRRIETGDGKPIEEWQKTTFRTANEYVALTIVDMMHKSIDNARADKSPIVAIPLAGCFGIAKNDNTEWFIGYTPRYVSGVWISSPDNRQPLEPKPGDSNSALRVFNAFMQEFLKDKPDIKDQQFLKPPPMPEEMKEMFRQRQRELSLERAQMSAGTDPGEDISTSSPADADKKVERVTIQRTAKNRLRWNGSNQEKRKEGRRRS